jgi:hypothetical protein
MLRVQVHISVHGTERISGLGIPSCIRRDRNQPTTGNRAAAAGDLRQGKVRRALHATSTAQKSERRHLLSI